MTLRNLSADRPSATFDFRKSKYLDPRINFTRASFADDLGPTNEPSSGSADQVGGSYHMFNVNVPRLTDKGLLIEEARTNFIKNSTDFALTKGEWKSFKNGTGSDIVITGNQGVAPDGTATADRLVCDRGAGTNDDDTSLLRIKVNDKSKAMWSMWMKSNTGVNQTIVASGSGLFNANGDQYEVVTTEWKRFFGKNSDVRVGARGSTTDQVVDILVWGAQLEAGTETEGFHTSYIPTNGKEVTRAKDICEITGTNFSDWYNGGEGTVCYDLTRPDVTFAGGKGGGYLEFFDNAGVFIQPVQGQLAIRIGKESEIKKFTDNKSAKTATGYTSAATYSTTVNAQAVKNENTAVDFTTATQLHIGKGNNTVTNFWVNGTGTCTVQRFAFYPTRVSDTNLQALTY